VRRVLLILLGLWAVGGVLLGGVLLLQHMVALPVPDTGDARLRAQMAQVFPADGRWRAMHVLYRSCPCSQRTIAHLTKPPRPAALDELVLMIDDDGAAGAEDEPLRRRGFRVQVVTPAALGERFDLRAAPVLVVARPDGALAYVGGYNRHKQSGAYEDREIIAALRQEHTPETLPVFGCSTNEQLAKRLDPLGLRPP
jgi:hypothetical protein